MTMRPAFHFTARSGWINDPHGVTFHDGQYHAFFQYVPDSTVWAPNCHWGHATGPDLVSLTEGPIAIAPGEGDDGIWTGSLVTDDAGQTRILYTSTSQPNIGIGRVRIATPVDESWQSWTKGDFVADAPEGLDIVAYRDPFVLREPDGSWRMFIGAGLADKTATALSYRSRDLEHWDYEGIALQRSSSETEPVWMGSLWECPQIFEIDGRHVMVSSVWDDDVLYYAGYAIGDYADGRFVAQSWGRLTYGSSYYAPSFFRDADGKPALSFWMRGVADAEAGWASAHSVPFTLSLDGDVLVATPHRDLDAYRGEVDGEELPGLSGDLLWTPSTGSELLVTSGGVTAARLRYEDDTVFATVGDETFTLPGVSGTVRVILDAQAVEVVSTSGLLGLVVEPASERLVVTGADRVWSLGR
jgi:beta-fructofuranosidase